MKTLICYFKTATGCLVGINLNRPPAEDETVVEYRGAWPPPGYTLRWDAETGTVSVVPETECPPEGYGRYGTDPAHQLATVWLSRTVRFSSRGAFGVPFDAYQDEHDIVQGIERGVPLIAPGSYHIWGVVTYSVTRHFSILSRDLVLTLNGAELARYSISIYTRAQFTQHVGPVKVELTADVNAIGILSEPTELVLDPDRRIVTYPAAIVGGRRYTTLFIERI